MDEMLKAIANMSNEMQEQTFADLEKKLGKETTDILREKVFFIKLYTNENFYNDVVKTLGSNLYRSLA